MDPGYARLELEGGVHMRSMCVCVTECLCMCVCVCVCVHIIT